MLQFSWLLIWMIVFGPVTFVPIAIGQETEKVAILEYEIFDKDKKVGRAIIARDCSGFVYWLDDRSADSCVRVGAGHDPRSFWQFISTDGVDSACTVAPLEQDISVDLGTMSRVKVVWNATGLDLSVYLWLCHVNRLIDLIGLESATVDQRMLDSKKLKFCSKDAGAEAGSWLQFEDDELGFTYRFLLKDESPFPLELDVAYEKSMGGPWPFPVPMEMRFRLRGEGLAKSHELFNFAYHRSKANKQTKAAQGTGADPNGRVKELKQEAESVRGNQR